MPFASAQDKPALQGGLGDFVGSRAFVALGEFFGLGFDAFEHAAENEVVEGKHGIPVEDSEKTFWLKFCVLFEFASCAATRLNAEFEDGDARQFHLGAQDEGFVALDADDAPEIERFAVAEAIWMKAAATDAWTADESIHPATNRPEIFCGIPAVIAAEQ